MLSPPAGKNYQTEIKRDGFISDCEKAHKYSDAINPSRHVNEEIVFIDEKI
jgi:hypothetical protein